MDVKAKLHELARIGGPGVPTVSLFLTTRWADEHQRERARIFVAGELKRARATGATALEMDLRWIEEQVDLVIQQILHPEAHGVALFACAPRGLREVVPLAVSAGDRFVVAERPALRGLVEAAEALPAVLVAFVDGERARLIHVRSAGGADEVVLESDVPGHHRQGGWRLLAQTRYQRHIRDHQARHHDAVAEALGALAAGEGIERIVLAGDAATARTFADRLPTRLARRVAGIVTGTRWEPAADIAARARMLLGLAAAGDVQATVEGALTEAAKGGRAVAGVEGVLDAALRGAVHRLFLLRAWEEVGRRCTACGALHRGDGPTCRLCGQATTAVELGEALVERVLGSGGGVESVDAHDDLARAGGVAARLRY